VCRWSTFTTPLIRKWGWDLEEERASRFPRPRLCRFPVASVGIADGESVRAVEEVNIVWESARSLERC
jgi:hypothetical protein